MKIKNKRIAALAFTLAFAVSAIVGAAVFGGKNAKVASGETAEYGVDLACGRRIVSTEAESGEVANTYAVDGKGDTRYASKQKDDAFYYIDLGNTEKVNKVVIDWEAAYQRDWLSCCPGELPGEQPIRWDQRSFRT